MNFFTNLLKIYKNRKLYLISSFLDSTIGINIEKCDNQNKYTCVLRQRVRVWGYKPASLGNRMECLWLHSCGIL